MVSAQRQERPKQEEQTFLVAQQKRILEVLDKQEAQIKVALPEQMRTMEAMLRFKRIALTEIKRSEKLQRADPLSLLGAIIQAAQLGLELGSGLGHAFLIPYFNKDLQIYEAQMMPGFRGFIELMRRSGHVDTVTARIVRKGDLFEFEYGDDEKLRHVPSREPIVTYDKDKKEIIRPITDAYAHVRLKTGGILREVMTREQIDWIMERKKDTNPVWTTDYDEMARKTVVRRISKYSPLSPQLAQAITLDNSFENEESQGNFQVIDAEYTPPKQEHDPEKIRTFQREGSGPLQAETDARKVAAISTFNSTVSKALAERVDFRRVQGWPENHGEWLKTATTTQIVTMTDMVGMAVQEVIDARQN